MKKYFAIVIIIILAAAGWQYRFSAEKFFKKFPQLSQVPSVSKIAEDISAPPPLIGGQDNQNSYLTRAGVIAWTNTNRRQNGNLPALTENLKLDKAAELKLQDMFKQQYFEHVNPQGVGPGDLAKQAGYDFISEGENLALGNFTDDQDLLTAWMNSPGHRANILNPKYQEMGAAVGEGMYQGHETWLAVQEFGKPASSCPSINTDLKSQVDNLQSQVNQMGPQLAALKAQIDSAHPQSQSDYDAYNQNVANYNNMVGIYNNKVDSLKMVTAEYNSQVELYNNCLGS
jgi:uncharacterized protein YkwD